MKVRRFSVAAMCLVLFMCTFVYSAGYDQNGGLSLLKGDLNRDGFLDIADAILFASAWLEQDCSLSNPCEGADTYPECGDGTVDFRDFGGLAGAWGSCTDPCDPCCTPVPLTLYEPPTTALTIPIEIIALFSGEFYQSDVDMRIPGIGKDFVWARTYRSRTGINTSMGNNWSHSYDIYIKACSGNIILYGPTGRRDVYYAQPNGTWAARGFFREISQNPDGSFTMVFRDKGEWKFNSFEDTIAPGKINAILDRNGNTVSFEYDYPARLVTIHTSRDDVTHSRDITIAYNVDGLVESVTDHTGRQVKYEYYSDGDSKGSAGDLKSVTTPAVTGTPTGNDFPGGKKTVYTYTKGFEDKRRNHNLLTITDPNGQTYLRNLYFNIQDPEDRDFDRVKRQIIGEEANDIIDVRYRNCAPRAGNNFAVIVAIVNDRAGNVRHYWFDQHN
ncbi:MAG: hypothetical protein GWN67_07420, partial [Phycisphaerae bacterium]|nr:hypothetical protein [Phycisphaerae bacterium]NIR67005.1 hypothetical protein [candidate division Zixibacteria bacterium]NIP54248.1 hypothetical protein [Phycisphaerae bacterium]NIS50974.1 hypothetical protein [Phycisphaerae bacterium]NIU08633.1 hypothetical protein [Phycisphaerae bacterium]